MSGSTVRQEILPEVLKRLTLPSPDTLTHVQVTGAACVWTGAEPYKEACGEPSFDLGEQTSPLPGTTSPRRWSPRTCRTHLTSQAFRGLHDHSEECRLCTDKETAPCPVGRSLIRLLLRGTP